MSAPDPVRDPAPLVRSESADRIVTITLDSPANRNALSRRLVAQLREALAAAATAGTAHAVLLTHTGTTFCSGAALDEMRDSDPADGTRAMLDLFRQLLTLPIPVVARVDGAARAGGLGVLGACDVVLASASSTFAFTEVRLGLAPAVICLPLRPLLTARAAARYFLTGETFGAAVAAQIGLVTAAGDDVGALASDVLDGLRRADPQGLRETKPLTTGDRLRAIDEQGAAMGQSSARLFASPGRAVSLLRLPRNEPERLAMMTPTAPAGTDLPVAALLRDRLDHWARVRPDDTAVTFGEQTYTWGQWRQRILRLTGALRDAGVRRGDRLAVLDLNHLATVELTLAASSLGAATVPVNARLGPEQIRYILGDSQPVILFHGSQLAEVAIAAGADTLVPRRIVIGGDDEYEPFLVAGQTDEGADVGPDDVCLVMYTSGTTGHPKGAQLTHRGVNAHGAACCTAMSLGPDSTALVAMPLFHVGGTSYAQVAIHGGARMILLREPAPAALFGAVASGATHTFVVPTIIHGVLAAGQQAIAAFSGLRSISYGAAPMPLPMLRQALDAWPEADLVQVYGMTEISGVATLLTAEAHRDSAHPERLASGGLPLPGVEVRVVDPVTLEDVKPGERGEIWFRSAQAMRGYLNKPQATAATKTADGWIRSGDIGRADDAGFVYVLDRVKDMIITGGENVYGPEVESVLSACPGVHEGVIIGIPDERWGEAVKAVVVPAPGAELSAADVIGFCRARLAHYQCPSSVDFVEDLPRNATGKVLKRALREPYWAGRERAI